MDCGIDAITQHTIKMYDFEHKLYFSAEKQFRKCFAETYDGWNIRKIDIWNKAALLKILWAIDFKRRSCGSNGSTVTILRDTLYGLPISLNSF